METSLFQKLIDEASHYPDTIIVLHRRGESLLHPNFVQFCEHVKGKFKEIQLATNATLLDEQKSKAIIEAVNFISFSIDVPEVFNKTRLPARYQDVEDKISRFLALNKGKVKTQVSMVKTQTTKGQDMALFKETWKGKVDRIRIYEEHSVGGVFGSVRSPRKERKPCIMPFYEMLIYFDGKVGRCNHDWNGQPLGDLKGQTITQVWNNHSYAELRAQHVKLEFIDEVCASCDSWYAEVGKQGTGEVIEE
jgi:radical SAM protein with 4Fe4S-binding SPASM domain